MAYKTIAIDDSLPKLAGLFDPSCWRLNYYDKALTAIAEPFDVLICRANTKVNQSFLNGHQPKLIATASSGSDHIDKSYLTKQQIHWCDAKGCNAKAVADYIYHLLAHPLFPKHNKKIGIIGIGKVGTQVSKLASALHYQVVEYDPPKQSRQPDFQSANFESLLDCDIISLHVPLVKEGAWPTHNLIDEAYLAKLKTGTIIINAARGGTLSEKAMLANPQHHYCLDVFENEPSVNPKIIRQCLFATPHIAGHAIEAKMRAMVMLAKEISLFFDDAPAITPYDHLLTTSSNNAEVCNSQQFLYDPMEETSQLKQTPTADTFKTLRASHNFRHELENK